MSRDGDWDLGTGMPMNGTAAMFVATNLAKWTTDQPRAFARDVQVNDSAYRRLDPEYYAWLRSRMNLAKHALDAGKISGEAFDDLRASFNPIHEWAVRQFGEAELLQAVRALNSRDYPPPICEPQAPPASQRKHNAGSEDALALVDAIRDRALALGWTEDTLYRFGVRSGFDRDRGLVAYLKVGDRIGEVTAQSIEVILPDNVRQRFYNPHADQPWMHRIEVTV